MSRIRTWASLLAALALPLGACELAEVTTASSKNLVVVEGILRAGGARQHILLHRPPGASASTRVPGAEVVVTASDGRKIPFAEAGLESCVDIPGFTAYPAEASCYTSAAADGAFVEPGAVYDLRIRTPDGGRIQSRTRVPGVFRLVSPAPTSTTADEVEVCTLPPNTPLPLVWTASDGTWVYVANVSIFGLRRALQGSGIDNIPEPLELTGLAISREDTTLVLPGEIGIFERGGDGSALLLALQNGFPEGVLVNLTLAAADRNYVNSVRGGTFNPSGNVRISSVSGDGIGVFGSVVPLWLSVRVGREPEPNVAPCLRGEGR